MLRRSQHHPTATIFQSKFHLSSSASFCSKFCLLNSLTTSLKVEKLCCCSTSSINNNITNTNNSQSISPKVLSQEAAEDFVKSFQKSNQKNQVENEQQETEHQFQCCSSSFSNNNKTNISSSSTSIDTEPRLIFASILKNFTTRLQQYMDVQQASLIALAQTSQDSNAKHKNNPVVQEAAKYVFQVSSENNKEQEQENVLFGLTLPPAIIPPLSLLGHAKNQPILSQLCDSSGSGGFNLIAGEFVLDSSANQYLSSVARDRGYSLPLFFHSCLFSTGSNTSRLLMVPKSRQEESQHQIPVFLENNNNNGDVKILHNTSFRGAADVFRSKKIGASSFPILYNVDQLVPTLTAAVPGKVVAEIELQFNDTLSRIAHWQDEYEQLVLLLGSEKVVEKYFSEEGKETKKNSFQNSTTLHQQQQQKPKHYINSLVKCNLTPQVAQHHILMKISGDFGRHNVFIQDVETFKKLEELGISMQELELNQKESEKKEKLVRVSLPPSVSWLLELKLSASSRTFSKNTNNSVQKNQENENSLSTTSTTKDPAILLSKDVVKNVVWELRVFDSGKLPPPSSSSWNWSPVAVEYFQPMWTISSSSSSAAAEKNDNQQENNNYHSKQEEGKKAKTVWIRRVRLTRDTGLEANTENDSLCEKLVRYAFSSSSTNENKYENHHNDNNNNNNFNIKKMKRNPFRYSDATNYYKSRQINFAKEKSLEAEEEQDTKLSSNNNNHNRTDKFFANKYQKSFKNQADSNVRKHKTFLGNVINIVIGQHLEKAFIANTSSSEEEKSTTTTTTAHHHGTSSSSPSSNWITRVWYPSAASLKKRCKKIKRDARPVKMIISKKSSSSKNNNNNDNENAVVTYYNEGDVEDDQMLLAMKEEEENKNKEKNKDKENACVL